MGKIGRIIKWATWGLIVAAIVQELRKPKEDREWHGDVAGFVPYDFRVPTPERVKSRLWNPEGPIVNPQVFGVGWTLNLGRVRAAMKES